MKIAILGYGKMGKEIEKIAVSRKHTIGLIIDINNAQDFTIENLRSCDTAIDFSIPASAYQNIMTCFEAGIPIVSGTTGWLERYDDVTVQCNQLNGSFFYASNYSLGVNIFFSINKKLAEIMNRFTDYDVSMEEIHHTQKLDAPSGTAITLANDIIKLVDRKSTWKLKEDINSPDILSIEAKRIENIPGTHIVNYDSPVDYIEIKHAAKSRQGFALGAVLAAEFLFNKKGIFGMKDLLGFE